MYRPPSPLFDVPELPSLRRVKPLPKRRRTSDPRPDDDQLSNATHAGAGDQDTSPNHTDADEPPTQDPTLTAQMALQAYYHPVLGGVRDLFKNTAASGNGHANGNGAAIDIDLSSALSGVLGYSGVGGAGSVDGQDDEDGEGDYVDHLQQPGNTKKRKVPANMSGSAHGHDAGSTGSGAEDEPLDRGHPSNREGDADSVSVAGAAAGAGGGGGGTQFSVGRNGSLLGKKGRLSRATLAGLQHKEILKSRKRQLSAVIGALPHGDTLAVDQALSANALFLKAQAGGDPRNAPPPRVRLSRRRAARIARALRAWRESRPQPDKGDEEEAPVSAPSSDFTFECHTATSDRLVATSEEVALLHSQFEVEFARQAAKAAEAAKQAQAALNGPLAKRSTAKQAARTTGTNTADQKGALEQTLLGSKGKGGKKKKRSALANASNPHHLRNYVPSRLPHTGPPSAQQAVQNAQNLLTPLPLRFLSAEIPPRRRKKSEANVTPVATLTNPADEWICPFCEYELLYGDEQSYHRAVRNRKKILRRRRRARERAAAAASGVAPTGTASGGAENEDVHPGFDAPAAPAHASAKENTPASGGKQAKSKEGDRGGHSTALTAHV